ncbi:MAG: GTP-binding protein [Gammaproteobacteria bacterium]|nr:GTP-binding protein [Gammaproteobacteria bacterium]
MKPARPAPPFSVVGGFLGAGKTTLLNRLLAEPRAPRCAVLVNDFGDIAVDQALIQSHGGETIAMQNGCICCTIGDDLARGIATVLDLAARPEHIVVEASGVAHPGRVAEVARISPELAPGGVFVLADAGAIGEQLQDQWIADTVDRQLQSAGHILVSKLEPLPPHHQAGVIDLLSRRYPSASLSTTAEVQWAHLLEQARDRRRGAPPAAAHARFVARTLRSTAPVDVRKLAHWLEHSRDVYRMKGWAVDRADGRVKLIQAVGRRLNIAPCEADIEGLVAIVIGNPRLPAAADIVRVIGARESAD